MKLPEYTGQRTGIYHLPNINHERSWNQCWEDFLGVSYEEKIFYIDTKHSLLDIFWWCEDHCEGVVFLLFLRKNTFIGFHQKSDAAHFKLKWMGECS